jgi:cytochrome b subunit of formate dehydrogenase
MVDDSVLPEQPRVEPEIIPPNHGARQSDWRRSSWGGGASGETHATHRIYVTRLGPFGIALLLLAIAAVVAIVMIAVLGVVLIWIPVVAAVVIIGAVIRLLRSPGAR